MSNLSWLKRGDDAKKLTEQKEQQQQQAYEDASKLWRFFVKKGEERRITFVDGEIGENGMLDQPKYYEHGPLFWNGKYQFFLCKAQTNPGEGHVCPICEMGNKPALVALFTIIDHTVTKSKDGTKTYKDRKMLFVAKSKTYELLQTMAKKRGGLRGITFDAMRSKDPKSPGVGDAFDFVEKRDPAECEKLYTVTYKDKDGKEHTDARFSVADYDKEINVKSEDELRALGFGKGGQLPDAPHGGDDSASEATASGNYAEQM